MHRTTYRLRPGRWPRGLVAAVAIAVALPGLACAGPAAASTAAADPTWRDGAFVPQFGLGCSSDVQTMLDSSVGYFGAEDGTYPRVGDVYYGRYHVGVVGFPCSASDVVSTQTRLPHDTAFAVDSTHPVRCWAGPLDGTPPGEVTADPQFDCRLGARLDFGWDTGSRPLDSGWHFILQYPLVSTAPIKGLAEANGQIATRVQSAVAFDEFGVPEQWVDVAPALPSPPGSTPPGTPPPGTTPPGRPVPGTASPVSISHVSARVRTAGQTVSITATAPPGQVVDLLVTAAPSRSSRVIRAGTAGPAGSIRWTGLKPLTNSVFQVRQRSNGSLSQPARLAVRPAITLTARVLSGRVWRLRGTVTPHRPAQVVTICRVGPGGRLTAVGVARVNRLGGFILHRRLTTQATTFVARTRANAVNAAGQSARISRHG
jgi:hypothetical protein